MKDLMNEVMYGETKKARFIDKLNIKGYKMSNKAKKLFKKILTEEKLSDHPKNGMDRYEIHDDNVTYVIVREDLFIEGVFLRSMSLIAYDLDGNLIDCLAVAGLLFDDEGNVAEIIFNNNKRKEVK